MFYLDTETLRFQISTLSAVIVMLSRKPVEFLHGLYSS
jgi:hypothetical protein